MSKKDAKILRFPAPAPSKADYQRVKSTYSVHDIKQLFGLSERLIRRWTEEGVVGATTSDAGDPVYDFRALTLFRRSRELRAHGLTLKQIERELQGQMNLFKPVQSPVARLLSPFEEALLLHERGDEKAAALYREAIAEGDNLADAYCNLGIIELDHAGTPKALDCFTLALKHDPRHVEAHYNLANLYFDAGDLQLAKLHYETAAELEPSFCPLHYNLALVYYKLDDLQGACAALHRYKELALEDHESPAIDELLSWLEQARDIQNKRRGM